MKSQAETAGRLSRGSTARPHKGTVVRDLELPLADGTRRLLSTARAGSNLVMIFTAGQDFTAYIASLTGKTGALKENYSRVLVIVLQEKESRSEASARQSPRLVAIDSGGQIHRMLGATDAAGSAVPTIYITDRFGEVFAAFQNPNAAALPDAEEIIRWLEFINQQCEECSPPEWPE
jgi:AhpC/TSA family